MQAARAVELLKYCLWNKNGSQACTNMLRMVATAMLLGMVSVMVAVTEAMKAMPAMEAIPKTV